MPSLQLDRLTATLPEPLARAVEARFKQWEANDCTRRLWARDASVWTSHDEARWLGWLDLPQDVHALPANLIALAGGVRRDPFKHVLLLGMGGSSMFPEVLAAVYGSARGYPELLVLDSTDPAQIAAFEARIDIARTLFIVASKSGSTLEPNILAAYFMQRVRDAGGAEAIARQLVAITDPQSNLQKLAERERFRAIVEGMPSVGGRYSALSNFGLAPLALLGVDARKFLGSAAAMRSACQLEAVRKNPGVALGIIVGEAALGGRDKLTIVASPALAPIGAWLEQLVAESLGKNGRGVVPIAGEALGKPERYGEDRLFVQFRLEGNSTNDRAIAVLERAGHAVVKIAISDRHALGGEVFRWEIATAAAGSVLSVNAFDQPDVEAAKIAARALTDAFEAGHAPPPETPSLREGDIAVYGLPAQPEVDAVNSLAGALRAHLARIVPGDYFALLAFIEMSDANDAELAAIRQAVRDAKQIATTIGYGPRFLHSTGQLHKGGPNTGVFVMLTCEEANDIAVPDRKASFGMVKLAQALGDYSVLRERGRRVLRVHLGHDVAAGLKALRAAFDTALSAEPSGRMDE